MLSFSASMIDAGLRDVISRLEAPDFQTTCLGILLLQPVVKAPKSAFQLKNEIKIIQIH